MNIEKIYKSNKLNEKQKDDIKNFFEFCQNYCWQYSVNAKLKKYIQRLTYYFRTELKYLPNEEMEIDEREITHTVVIGIYRELYKKLKSIDNKISSWDLFTSVDDTIEKTIDMYFEGFDKDEIYQIISSEYKDDANIYLKSDKFNTLMNHIREIFKTPKPSIEESIHMIFKKDMTLAINNYIEQEEYMGILLIIGNARRSLYNPSRKRENDYLNILSEYGYNGLKKYNMAFKEMLDYYDSEVSKYKTILEAESLNPE